MIQTENDVISELLPALKKLKPPGAFTVEDMKKMFVRMCVIREFEQQVRTIWMAGEIYGLSHACVGAEALAVGTAKALRKDDFALVTHRGHGHCLARGASSRRMMAELFGKYEGVNRGRLGSMHIGSYEHKVVAGTGILGSSVPMAVGMALSAKRLNTGSVTICLHGDGSSNEGAWHEAMNMCALWNLPAVIIIENNGYAVSTSVSRSTKQTQLYKRAEAYGMEGVRMDGFNVFDVYETVKKAVDKARGGGGPTLIEASYSRLVGHFLADDQKRYRDLEIVDELWKYEPIKRLEEYFLENGLVAKQDIEKLRREAVGEVADALEYCRTECTEPPLDTLFDDLYANGELID